MSLIDVDKDPWLTEYESCERLHRDVVELLNQRSTEMKTSDTYGRLSSSIRIRLKQYDTEVQQLGIKLRELALSRTITLDEAERRERLIENLNTNIIQLQRRFNDRDLMSTINRSELIDSRRIVQGFNNVDDDVSLSDPSYIPDDYTVSQIRSQRQKILKDQDAGLEELAKTISRQKQIAINIDNEVDTHNNIIDDISDRMERTAGGIQRETEEIAVISRRSSTWNYWLIIIALLISIIIVLFI